MAGGNLEMRWGNIRTYKNADKRLDERPEMKPAGVGLMI